MKKALSLLVVILFLLVTFDTFAKTPAGLSGTLIVLNKGGHDASFIDLASGDLIATLPTGRGPHELVVSEDGQWAVSTDYAGGDSLTVFNINALTVQRTINLDQYPRPHGMLLMPGSNEVIVTSEASRSVVMVDFITGKLGQSISTEQSGSHMVALSDNGSMAFTANGGSDSVSVIDPIGMQLLKKIAVQKSPEAITSNRSGDQIWVGSNDEGTVSVISVDDGSTLAQWDGFGWAYRVLLTEDERFALVPDMRKSMLRMFDVESRSELETINIPDDSRPQGMALYSDDRTLFLSLSAQNKVLAIDIRSRKILGEYQTGTAPDGIGYSELVVRK